MGAPPGLGFCHMALGARRCAHIGGHGPRRRGPSVTCDGDERQNEQASTAADTRKGVHGTVVLEVVQSTMAVTARFAVTFAPVMNMSGMMSKAIRTPMPSRGSPNA